MSWLNADPRFVAGGDGHGLGRLLRPRPVRSLRGRGHLSKTSHPPRALWIRANSSPSRAPSHVEEGRRQLRTLDQEIEGSNPSSPAKPQHLGPSLR